MEDRLLTVQEVADRLNLKVRTIYGVVSKSEMPSVKVGVGKSASIRIRESDLDAFLRKQTRLVGRAVRVSIHSGTGKLGPALPVTWENCTTLLPSRELQLLAQVAMSANSLVALGEEILKELRKEKKGE